ncbi:ABC transporter permease [Anoxybacillus geothermalis]|uniref:ABC transporter permease n=1 Tax=Geobacillus TaxID=129337 RepID=UPI0007AF97D6|nr:MULTISPECIES: ABC transporter permease [Geobacillus]MED0653117.1 ABC transporter permease [Anoxybacillus geothermalis]KZM58641.1 iron ABC transporter permease [Geobacillus stearothermophilus]MDF9297176.1 ABC transporter permease [Geobacillus stearothermophilus]MED5073414.1 ABC transporter permease [Anoxybacillus geothermalis]NNU99654.1 ABC transporter permease [Geobacillus sp. DSP4a]
MKKWMVLLVVLAAASLFVGVHDLSPRELFAGDREAWEVFLISRLPRLISILIAGSSVSICGLIMQQLSQNRFVSPTTAGTMDWARLGLLVSMIAFAAAGPLVKAAIAVVFAFAGTLLFITVLDRVKYKDSIFIPLIGLMFGNIVGSVTTFLAYKYDLIQSMSAWMHGDFSVMMQGRYEMLYVSVPLMAIAYVYANRFTIAGMGEEMATNLGVRYRSIVYTGLLIVAVVSAVEVLTVGTLPFLGLIVPNIVTMYYGDHLRKVLPLTAIFGALFVLICDVFGRVAIYPYEIPIGLTVGVIGSGVFLYLLVRRTKQYV